MRETRERKKALAIRYMQNEYHTFQIYQPGFIPQQLKNMKLLIQSVTLRRL